MKKILYGLKQAPRAWNMHYSWSLLRMLDWLQQVSQPKCMAWSGWGCNILNFTCRKCDYALFLACLCKCSISKKYKTSGAFSFIFISILITICVAYKIKLNCTIIKETKVESTFDAPQYPFGSLYECYCWFLHVLTNHSNTI